VGGECGESALLPRPLTICKPRSPAADHAAVRRVGRVFDDFAAVDGDGHAFMIVVQVEVAAVRVALRDELLRTSEDIWKSSEKG
jgi:hypothetical protein